MRTFIEWIGAIMGIVVLMLIGFEITRRILS